MTDGKRNREWLHWRGGATLAVVLLLAVCIVAGGGGPTAAQGGSPPVANVRVVDGPNPGEVVITWDAVPSATHYRIGYVNMATDYHLAKASVTGDWINAFIYVDENARNLPVANGPNTPSAAWSREPGTLLRY